MPGPLGTDLRLWTRTELRRRWLSLVLLGVLGGSAAGLSMAAYDGAQRSESAYQRMRGQLHGADAVIFPSQVGVYDFDATMLDGLAEVESWGGFALNDSVIDGLPPGATPFITSGGWLDTIEGAVVVDGRLPDPNRDDEAVITTPILAESDEPGLDIDIGIGSTFVWRNLSLEDAEQFPSGVPPDFDWTTADGVVTTLKIVGVVRLPIESVAAFASDGLLITSPAWEAQHGADTSVYFTNALVRLRNGAADLPALAADVARLTGRDDIPIKDLSTDIKRVQRSLDVEHTALLMFAGAVALAALVLVGQAIVRATASGAAAVPALRAMGATTGALVVGLAIPMTVTVVALVATTAVVSIVASQWFPVGLARSVDPDLGVRVLAGREAVGLLVTAGIALAVIGASALSLQRVRRANDSRRARLLGAATRAGVPLPPAIGASLAVDPSTDSGGRSRLALLAGIAGVVAAVAALTLVRGIDDIVRHPERTGATWDLVVEGTGERSSEEVLRVIADAADVADFAFVGRLATHVGGLDAPVYALDVRKGSFAFTVVDGRVPVGDDEVALGPATMRSLDASIGDSVAIGPQGRSMTVVGSALLSQQPHSSFDEGAWVSTAAYELFAEDKSSVYEEAFIGLADGVSASTAIGNLPSSWSVRSPTPSTDAANLMQVRSLPIYLAGFVAFLAVGAVAHALFTSARQRARELAVLRALGLTARQAAACVSWQAVAIGAVAVAVGMPIGVIVGRRIWRAITEQLSFVYVGPWTSGPLAVAVPVCLLCCVVLAILPARSTAQRGIADTLREE